MNSINGDLLRGHLDSLILATLERGEAHGLEILKRLEHSGCGLLKLKEGSLYPALHRLEADGAVKATWEEGAHGRRGARRRIYKITLRGHRVLAKGRAQWTRFVAVVGPILGAPA